MGKTMEEEFEEGKSPEEEFEESEEKLNERKKDVLSKDVI
jgi:hypothetical protein